MDEENKVPTIRQFPLERSKIMKKFIASEISGLIGLFVLYVLLAFVLFVANSDLLWPSTIAAFVLFIFLSIANYWYQVKYFETYYYDIRENFLVIKKGVFMPRETILPFEKLQDVYVDQDLLDRMFSLLDLHVSTATFMSGAEAHIDGVNKSNANAMRELILSKIRESKKGQ